MKRASDNAYGTIKSWIQTGEIPPGGQIDDVEIAARLGMSRTPVREALLRLQNEGFVSIERGQGIRVLALSSKEMRDIYQVISGLEIIAVSLLARRQPSSEQIEPLFRTTREMRQALAEDDVKKWGMADEEFHRELFRLSGNRKLCEVGCQMRDYVLRAHMVALRLQTNEYRTVSTDQHEDLLRTILSRSDQVAAETHLRQRQRGEDALIDVVERFNISTL